MAVIQSINFEQLKTTLRTFGNKLNDKIETIKTDVNSLKVLIQKDGSGTKFLSDDGTYKDLSMTTATSTTNGLMSSSDKSKLDGITPASYVNVVDFNEKMNKKLNKTDLVLLTKEDVDTWDSWN